MPDDAALAEATDPAVLRAERRLRMLEKLAQLEMELAEALQRQAIAAANPTPPAQPDAAAASGPGTAPETAGDLSAAFARIARSLRLTLALQARAEEQLRALLAGEAAKVEVRRAEASRRAAAEARARSERHRNEVERLVCEAAEREVEDLEALDGVLEALEERLDEDEAYWDLDEHAPARGGGAAVRRSRTHPRLEPLGRRGLDAQAAFLPVQVLALVAAPAARPWGRPTTVRPRSAPCSAHRRE